jgi:hypothetical protein
LEEALCDPLFLEAKCRAGLTYDALGDCDRALAAMPSSAVEQIKTSLTAVLSAVLARPDVALQALHNQWRWLPSREPLLNQALQSSEEALMKRGPWLRAEARLAEEHRRDGGGFRFASISPVQYLDTERGALALAREGLVEVRSLPNGELLRIVPVADRLSAVTVAGTGHRLAWATEGGLIHLEGASVTVEARTGERLLVFDGETLFAVDAEDNLVRWSPERGVVQVLAKKLPFPLVSLQLAPNGQRVLYVAGSGRRGPQRLAVCALQGEGWVERSIPYQGPPIRDARADFLAGQVLLACQDRALRVVELGSGRHAGEVRYEQVGRQAVLGPVQACAVGRGDRAGLAFLATDHGHLAAWDWKENRMERLPDFGNVQVAEKLCTFDVLPGSDDLLLSFPDRCELRGWASRPEATDWSQAPVTACTLTPSRQVVAACAPEHTLRWYSAKGLVSQRVWVDHRLDPVALAPAADGRSVVVGTSQGVAWLQSPTEEVEELDQLFNHRVVSVCATAEGGAICSEETGRMVETDFRREGGTLWTGRVGQSVRKVVRADRWGRCILWLSDNYGGKEVVTLVTNKDRETVLWESSGGLYDLALSPDGRHLCLAAAEETMLLEAGGEHWAPAADLHRQSRVQHAAFLGHGELLAVVAHGEPWLEVWRVQDGLHTLVAQHLPADATCLATEGYRIAVGLSNGRLLSLVLENFV